MSDERLNVTRHEAGDPPWVREAERVLTAYGVACATAAETRARVGVLDRMGAFAPAERRILAGSGWLTRASDEKDGPTHGA